MDDRKSHAVPVISIYGILLIQYTPMKKNLFILVALIMVAASATAQTEQGKWMVGGSLGVTFGNTKAQYDGTKLYETKQFSTQLDPHVGYFVTDGLAVGLGIGLTSSTEKYDSDNKDTQNALLVGPFARYYTPVGLFMEASVGLGSVNIIEQYEGEKDEYKSGVFGWSVGVGYAIFINEHVSLEPSFSYNNIIGTSDEDSKLKTKTGLFLIAVGFNILL